MKKYLDRFDLEAIAEGVAIANANAMRPVQPKPKTRQKVRQPRNGVPLATRRKFSA